MEFFIGVGGCISVLIRYISLFFVRGWVGVALNRLFSNFRFLVPRSSLDCSGT